MLLFTALGFYLSWDKCLFVFVQRGKYLELIVDSSACQMFVPANQKKKVVRLLVVCCLLGTTLIGSCQVWQGCSCL